MANATAGPNRSREQRYFAVVSAALLLLVFLGFAQSYYLKSYFGTPALSALLHVHGIVMTLWFALFAAQVSFVAQGRLALHRRLGLAGFFLAILVALLGAAVSLSLARARLLLRADSTAAPFLLGLQLFSIVCVFAVLIFLGFRDRRRPDFHKRWMTLSMLSVLGPAVTRLPFPFVQNHDVSVAIVLSISFILLTILGDSLLHRRLHPAFGWGGLLVIGSIFVVAPLAQTQPWIRTVRWLLL